MEKLNDLINEYEEGSDNEGNEEKSTAKKGTPILSPTKFITSEVIRKNVRFIHEMEEMKKSGHKVVSRRRKITPFKRKFVSVCCKFKQHPEKFFTILPGQHYFDTLEIKTAATHSCGNFISYSLFFRKIKICNKFTFTINERLYFR